MTDERPMRLRRSLGPAGSRRRRALHYTRGFLRPVVLGGIVAFLVPLVVAIVLWDSAEHVRSTTRTFGSFEVAAGIVGGALAASLLPAHPRASEGAKNGAIAAMGAVGVAYAIAWTLGRLDTKFGLGDFMPVQPTTLAQEMVKFLLLGAVLAGTGGAFVGYWRGRAMRASE